MNNVTRERLVSRLFAGTLLAAALALAAVTGVVDRSAEAQYEQMLKRALITFAVARTLNGIISVIKETEIALQPAGVGVKLAPGQILDPINDLIEQFSWIMLASAASLAIQRLLMEISHWHGMTLVLLVVLAFWWATLFRQPGSPLRQMATRMLLLAVFLRFAVPAVVLASDVVFQVFLSPTYQSAQIQVESTQEQLAEMHERQELEVAEKQGVGATLGRWWDQTADSLRIRERLTGYQKLVSGLIENVVQLIAVFVLQTILLPLFFLWVMWRLWHSLWRQNG